MACYVASLCPLALCLPSGLTVAEYFRDVEGQDVLLFVDNIFRFTQVRALSDQPVCADMVLILYLSLAGQPYLALPAGLPACRLVSLLHLAKVSRSLCFTL